MRFGAATEHPNCLRRQNRSNQYPLPVMCIGLEPGRPVSSSFTPIDLLVSCTQRKAAGR